MPFTIDMIEPHTICSLLQYIDVIILLEVTFVNRTALVICECKNSTYLSPAAPKARDGRYCNARRLSVCLSVRPSRLVFAL